MYWDNRPHERQGRGRVKITGKCSTGSTTAFTFSSHRDRSLPCYDVITLCPRLLTSTRRHNPLSGRLPLLREKALGTSYHIDEFAKRNLALTYIHELSHCDCLSEYSDMLGRSFS
jgi:hypothetical protein